MTREEKIKQLYVETYMDEDVSSISIKDMEEALESYYSAAGFNIYDIDDLYSNHEESKEFIDSIEAKIEEVLKNK